MSDDTRDWEAITDDDLKLTDEQLRRELELGHHTINWARQVRKLREARVLKMTPRPSSYWETPAMPVERPKRLLPVPDRRLVHKLEDYEQTYRALHRIAPAALAKMRDQLAGQPGAASYDGPGIHTQTSVMWCWKHECELAECLKAGESCRGESVVVADPTGEAGIRPDEVEQRRHQLDADLKAIDRLTESVQATLLLFATGRKASPTERDASTDSTGQRGCESCSRLPSAGDRTIRRWEPPLTKQPTTVHGTLPEPLLLCRVCYDFVKTFGKLPSVEELRHRHDTGRWRKHEPKKRAS